MADGVDWGPVGFVDVSKHPLLSLGLAAAVSGCFGATEIAAPEPNAEARAVMVTSLSLEAGTVAATLYTVEAYQSGEPLLFIASERRPERIWIEFLSVPPESIGLGFGPLPLAGALGCGVRAIPRSDSISVLDPGKAEFVVDPSGARPELLNAGRCVCPAPVVERIALEELCAIRPAPLPDGRAFLVVERDDGCDAAGAPFRGHRILDLDALEFSKTTTLAYLLDSPLALPSGELYFGNGHLDGTGPTELYGFDLAGGLQRLMREDDLGRIAAIASERSGRTLLFLTKTEPGGGLDVPSRLFRFDLSELRVAELPLPPQESAGFEQQDVLLQRAEADVLVFPGHSALWHRVAGGELRVELPVFPGVGHVQAGTVHPDLGPIVATRLDSILRFDETLPELLPYELEGGPQRLNALFAWGDSVGFITEGGELGQARQDEARCPIVSLDPGLRNPSVAVFGDRALVAGRLRRPDIVALYLVRLAD